MHYKVLSIKSYNFLVSAALSAVFFLLLLIFVDFGNPAAAAASISSRLSGRILLQVESHGEAWYVLPQDNTRLFLGRPADAYAIMRQYGLGIKSAELKNYLDASFPPRLSGRILLDVENNGEAYYVWPQDLKGYYLGTPADAFKIMRELALGISDKDLKTIFISSGLSVPTSGVANPAVEPVSGSISESAPMVRTIKPAPMLNYSQIAAISGEYAGIVASDIAEKGIVWGFSNDPTVSNNIQKSISSQKSNQFSADIIGLVPSATHYVRAYLITRAGKIYYGATEIIGSADNALQAPALPVVSYSPRVSYRAGAHGSLTGTVDQTLNWGQNATAVTAVADYGYRFVRWNDNDSTANPRTDLNVSRDIAATAIFVAIEECGAATVCNAECMYSGELYPTVLLGSQCWFKKNLNIGTMIGTRLADNVTFQNQADADAGVIQKYCSDYIDSDDTNQIASGTANCIIEGGLYQWHTAMALPQSCDGAITFYASSTAPGAYDANCGAATSTVNAVHQGMCPTGWHMPSDDDWLSLELTYSSAVDCTNTRTGAWWCAPAGHYLKKRENLVSTSSNPLGLGCSSTDPDDSNCGASGFDAIFAGAANTNGTFLNHTTYAYLLVGTPVGAFSNQRRLRYFSDGVLRGAASNARSLAASVRCIKD